MILPVKITEHKKGLKLESFLSLNVYPGEYCEKSRLVKSSICNQCYGYYLINRYPRLKSALKFNSNVLSSRILTSRECKDIEKKINGKKNLSGLRFNSIGELLNDIHVINLQNIAYEIDPKIPITLWTKRDDILFKVLDKPLFKIIESSRQLNRFLLPVNCDDRIQHTFNVYDNQELMNQDIRSIKEYKKDIPVMICNGKCKECMICYSHIDSSEQRYAIFELTKRAQMKKDKGTE